MCIDRRRDLHPKSGIVSRLSFQTENELHLEAFQRSQAFIAIARVITNAFD
jgi:hypothetical protein